MKNFNSFLLLLSLSVLFLLISCENTPPTETVDPISTITKDTIPTVKDPVTLVATDTVALDTTSLDTVNVPQKIARPTRKPAKIKFDKTSYTYDTIKQGDIIEYDFTFTNVGERPLSIKDVNGSCGCTIGSYSFLDIAPKEKSTIKARFDSKGKIGPQFTTITVYSNANPKGDVLSLKGFVVE